MSIWSTLGIDPTSDTSQIKRAYASMLKKHHPEDDPEGYQNLREAFNEAMKRAKQGHHSINSFYILDEEEYEEDADDDENQALAPLQALRWQEPNHSALNQVKSESELVEEFIDKLNSLYIDFYSRCDVDLWMELLNCDIVWKIGRQNILSNRVLGYLNEHYFLSGEIWGLLEGTFDWKETFSSDPEQYKEKYPNVYAYVLEETLVNKQGYLAVMSSSSMSATLFRLEAAHYQQMGDGEQALHLCERYIEFAPEDKEAMILHARILLGMNRLAEAVTELDGLRAAMPEHVEVLSLLGQCYMKLEQMESAREVYNVMLKLNDGDVEAVVNLAKIHSYTKTRIPTLPRKERRNAKRGLNRDLNNPPLHTRLRKSLWLMISKKWITIFFIILFHILIAISWNKQIDLPLRAYVKQMMYPQEPMLVNTMEDLRSLPPGKNAIQLELSQATYTGILEIEQQDEEGHRLMTYMWQDEAKKKDLLDKLSGYLCVGKLGDYTLIILANYEQTMEMYDNGSIQSNGVVQEISVKEISIVMEEWRQRNHFVGDIASDYYVVSKNGLRGSNLQPIIPFDIPLYCGLLALSYISLIIELHNIRRFLRFY
ncbi:Tetratricopeptide repeat protein [compost metagenome]